MRPSSPPPPTTDPAATEAGRRADRREALLGLALSVGRCGTFERDLDTGLARWSPETEAIYGLAPGTFDGLSETWLGYIHPDDRARVRDATRQALAARDRAMDLEYRIVRPDGEVRHVESRAGFSYREDGEPSAIYGVNVDITERKSAEDRHRESEARYHTLFDALPVGLVAVDPDTLGFAAFNDLAFAQLGYSREEFAALTIDRIDLRESRAEALEKAAGLVRSDRKIQFETLHRTKDGRARHVVVTARRIVWEGRPLLYASWIDVTEQAQIRDELTRTAQLLGAIADATDDLISAKDRDGRLIFANPAMLRVIGRDWDAAKGLAEADYFADPAQAKAVATSDRRVVETGEAAVVEERLTGPDGSERVFLSSKSPLRDGDGTIAGLVGIATDITERKRREEQVRFVMRELTHRTKNLLAVIQSIARQTAQVSHSPEDFQARFLPRLQGLSGSHDLLVESDWRGATIEALIGSQLPHLDEALGRQVTLDGEAMTLTPEAAQNLGLAFHELATNAVKSGALSTAAGRIAITWRREGDQLVVTWQERGGPPVTPPARRGFGQIVLERVVPRALDGEASLAFDPAGVTWTIRFPGSYASA